MTRDLNLSGRTPCFPLQNVANGLSVDAIPARQPMHGLAPCVPLAHLTDLSCRELRCRVPLSCVVRDDATGLHPHVRQVIGDGSQPEMDRIYARRVVADVHDDHSLRNCPVVKLPADTVRLEVLSQATHLPIAGRASRGFPLPAFVVALAAHLRPKLLIDRLGVSHV